MKNTFFSLSFFAVFGLLILVGAGCSSEAPLTEEEQAAQYGVSLEEYRDIKDAAARMNMAVDEHINMH